MNQRQKWPGLRQLAAGALALGLAAGLLTALVPASAQAADADLAAGPGADRGGWTAKIRRTEYGVPHILARDFGGVGYGYGYAFAQDNLCRLADQVVTVRGERSRWFGPDSRSVDRLGNLESDTFQQGVLRSGTVRRPLARPAPSGFLMATELTDRGPRTRTLLAYGQSADPTSPHFTDRTRRYARKQWVAERFTEAEIRSAPGLTVTTLRR
ncbi:penicillin acylase family protein [Kitasatospora sp. NPDC057692]|uniref:penicillin acylase family protein n=1 Tax=Kitasatospora sp. NPDC057692 TaxID=3346215 RepID=UPI0036BE2E6C